LVSLCAELLYSIGPVAGSFSFGPSPSTSAMVRIGTVCKMSLGAIF
jgi:hypothetical protein